MWFLRIALRRSASIAAVAVCPGRDRAGRDARRVATQSRQRERRIEHFGRAGLGGDRSGVADLAAALGVERGPVEEDLDVVALTRAAAVGHVDHREHAALGGVGAVPEELGDAELLDDLAVLVDQHVVDDTLARRLGPYPAAPPSRIRTRPRRPRCRARRRSPG